jgi:hypothetical protein
MEDYMSEDSAVQRLMQEVRDGLRNNIVNHYTCLTPKKQADGTQVLTVKDGRDRGVLEIVVRKAGTDND